MLQLAVLEKRVDRAVEATPRRSMVWDAIGVPLRVWGAWYPSGHLEDLVVAYIASVGQELLRERVCHLGWKRLMRRIEEELGRRAGEGVSRMLVDALRKDLVPHLSAEAISQHYAAVLESMGPHYWTSCAWQLPEFCKEASANM